MKYQCYHTEQKTTCLQKGREDTDKITVEEGRVTKVIFYTPEWITCIFEDMQRIRTRNTLEFIWIVIVLRQSRDNAGYNLSCKEEFRQIPLYSSNIRGGIFTETNNLIRKNYRIMLIHKSRCKFVNLNITVHWYSVRKAMCYRKISSN